MDKSTFIAKAPIIYAVAVVFYLEENMIECSEDDVKGKYSGDDEEHGEWNLLGNQALLELGLTWLHDRNIIELIKDDFGPSIIVPSDVFTEVLNALKRDKTLPFYGYGKTANRIEWISSALESVQKHENELEVSPEDLEIQNDEWAPIPIDRGNSQLEKAIENVENTLEQVRGSNGYAETASQEQAVVISGLSTLIDRLRSATNTSKSFVEIFGFSPLKLVAKRFGEALIGIAARAATEQLKDWLRGHGINFN